MTTYGYKRFRNGYEVPASPLDIFWVAKVDKIFCRVPSRAKTTARRVASLHCIVLPTELTGQLTIIENFVLFKLLVDFSTFQLIQAESRYNHTWLWLNFEFSRQFSRKVTFQIFLNWFRQNTTVYLLISFPLWILWGKMLLIFPFF